MLTLPASCLYVYNRKNIERYVKTASLWDQQNTVYEVLIHFSVLSGQRCLTLQAMIDR
jgi:hypothetical protein